jgi:hypothetical protein
LFWAELPAVFELSDTRRRLELHEAIILRGQEFTFSSPLYHGILRHQRRKLHTGRFAQKILQVQPLRAVVVVAENANPPLLSLPTVKEVKSCYSF